MFWLRWADDLLDPALEGRAVPASTRKRLEALVAAHGIHASDPSEREQSTGDSRDRFEGDDRGNDGPPLNETRFGRRAIELADRHGIDLAQTGGPTVEFAAYGAGTHDDRGPLGRRR